MSKVDASKMFKTGESEWFQFWNKRIKERIVVELRVDWKGLDKISHLRATFEAKVALFVRVAYEDLYYDLDRTPVPGQPHAVISEDGKVMGEWEPWLEFPGKLANKSSWIREEYRGPGKKPSHITFGYEIQGEFSSGHNSAPALYPFDYHELELSITSNWDRTKLIFVPWGEKDHWEGNGSCESMFEEPIAVCHTDYGRARKAELKKTLNKNWKFKTTPRMVFTKSVGFQAKHMYSEVKLSLFASRKPMLFVIYEVMRPFCLAALATLSLFLDAEIFSRIVFNTSILIAMSIAFLNASSAEKLTVAEFYKVLMFISASCAVLFMVIPLFNCGAGASRCVTERLDNLAFYQVGLLLALHIFLILVVIRYMPKRLRLKHRYPSAPRVQESKSLVVLRVNPDESPEN